MSLIQIVLWILYFYVSPREISASDSVVNSKDVSMMCCLKNINIAYVVNIPSLSLAQKTINLPRSSLSGKSSPFRLLTTVEGRLNFFFVPYNIRKLTVHVIIFAWTWGDIRIFSLVTDKKLWRYYLTLFSWQFCNLNEF